MGEWATMRTAQLLCLALAGLAGCVSIQRTGPDPRAQVDAACRAQADYYGDPAPVYASCMRKHGYKGVTAADY